MSLPPYDDENIRQLIDSLNKGNPARDADAKDVLRRIVAEGNGAGLSPEILDAARKAVGK